MSATDRPLPTPTGDSEAFWRACKKEMLTAQRCADCGRLQFYPRRYCTSCLSERLEWSTLSGRGKVYSHSTVFRALSPAFQKDIPYIVAVVELAEGLRMMTQIVECAPEAVFVGMPVEVTFDHVSDEIALPKFRRAEAKQP
ncbi:MAG: Zn-ribbon domain-containing OB-fold protein [Rhodospirillales bacterium]|nr:Zn-ribbon domain-containing OB-fold protein [Rhodospirillales bacterium]